MPYKGDGKQFSVRLPREYVEYIDAEAKRQHHNSKNAIIVQLLEKAIGQDVLESIRDSWDGEDNQESSIAT